MFDYTMLNDYEFEILCKDIFQREFEEKGKMYTFPSGRDGGVDICDKNQSYIIQVKHYSQSTVNNLIGSLKKEVEKINKLPNLEKYYIMTSLNLTREKKNEILGIFSKFIPDISHIWCKEDIDAFLGNELNSDIVRKNFKLWLNASNVFNTIMEQDVLIDSEELFESIESKKKLYVETKGFRDALKILEEHKILFLLGVPGVGKSTISEMLLLSYIDRDYKVRYVSSNNISKVKESLLNPEIKEIILLDDFLGQHYLKLDDNQPSEIKTLLSKIGRSKNKKIILNSRITIINEATRVNIKFQETIERYETEKYTIDLTTMSDLEKARIFYNHLYFYNVPTDHCRNIYFEKNYEKIVNHPNYNPRIMEFVTKNNNIETIKAEEYSKFIIERLENPEDIWKDEFENRLDRIDRVFMYTLYSLNDTKVNIEMMRKAFIQRLKMIPGIDTTMNYFDIVMYRLTKSLLSQPISKEDGNHYISVINPSVNDYIQKCLYNNEIEVNSIINTALYYEQIINMSRFLQNEKSYEERIFEKSFFEYLTVENNIYYYFLSEIFENKIKNDLLIDKVQMSVKKFWESPSEVSNEDFISLTNKILYVDFYEFYRIGDLNKVELMGKILDRLNFNTICNFFEDFSSENFISENQRDFIIKNINRSIHNAIYSESYILTERVLDRYNIVELIEHLPDLMSNITSDIEELLDSISSDFYLRMPENLFNTLREKEQSKEILVEDLLYELESELDGNIDYYIEILTDNTNNSVEDVPEESQSEIDEIFIRFE